MASHARLWKDRQCWPLPVLLCCVRLAQAAPVQYRLWHPRTGDHFYTTSSRDRRRAARAGYLDEGIRAYVLPARPR